MHSDHDSEPLTGEDITSSKKTFSFNIEGLGTTDNTGQVCEVNTKPTIEPEKIKGKHKGSDIPTHSHRQNVHKGGDDVSEDISDDRVPIHGYVDPVYGERESLF